jgi:integrase
VSTTKKKLTSRFVASAGAAAAGKRDEYRDTEVRAFGLRVTDRGKKSYIMDLRWPGSRMPTKRTIGDATIMPLATARQIAREWLELVAKGIDPEQAKRQREATEAQERAITFEAVAEDFINEYLSHTRRGQKDAQEIRRELVSRWGRRPVTHITRDDVLELVEAIKARGKLAMAHLVLSHAKRLWRWAIHQPSKRYGITTNPTREISPKIAIGKKNQRDRVLTDAELAAVWRALAQMDDPAARCLQLIMFTGMRREEAAQLSWKEVDLEERLITLPAPRFKSGVKFAIPLSDDAMALLRSIKRGNRGEFVFSNRDGAVAVNGWSRFMEKLHPLVAAELGHEPEEGWTPHDLRRSLRTSLSRLRVQRDIAELCIGHVKVGLIKAYDLWEAMDERREAFDAWADLLRTIVTPPEPGKILPMKKRRHARDQASA